MKSKAKPPVTLATRSQALTATRQRSAKETVVVPPVPTADHAMLATSAMASASTSMEKWSFAATTSADLIDQLHLQTERLKQGDMTDVEQMLYCQAVTLQAVFTKTLQHAMSTNSLKHQNMVLAVAFKAQSQCRTTLETLANIKNPRTVAFVKQANIANGPQQINNAANEFLESSAPARAREKTLPIEQNELVTISKTNHA